MVGDVGGGLQRLGFANETFDPSPVSELQTADCQRRRDQSHEGTKFLDRHVPDLNLDRHPLPGSPQESGLGRLGWQCMESVVRARGGGALKSGATVCELVIEGLTAKMGSHDGYGDHISYGGLVAGDGREPFVLKSRAYQSDAKGKAVGAKSSRDGKSGEIK